MKNKIFLIITLILLSVSFTGCGCSKKKDTTPEEIEDTKVANQDTIDGIQLTNISFTINEGKATIVTEVENTNDEAYLLKEFTIIVKDFEGKELTRVLYNSGETIESGQIIQVTSIIEEELSTAASIEYELKK